jgi:hypothetical protein
MVVVNMERAHASGLFRSAYLAPAVLFYKQLIIPRLRDIEIAVQVIFTKLLMTCVILVRHTLFALPNKLILCGCISV